MRRYWKKVKSPKRGAREGPPAAPLRLGRGPAAGVRFLAQGQERGGGTATALEDGQNDLRVRGRRQEFGPRRRQPGAHLRQADECQVA